MSNAQPIHLRRAHEKLPFGASATSSDILDPCLVNDHPAVSIWNTENEEFLTDDIHQSVKFHRTDHFLSPNDQDYMEKIKEFHDRLDMMKVIVRPGCSDEVLNSALSFMSSLVTILSEMPQKLHASL